MRGCVEGDVDFKATETNVHSDPCFRISWRPAVALAVMLAGCSHQAMAQYRLLGVPGEAIPVHTHFPGLCPGSSLTLCPAQLGLRPGFEVKPIDRRDGWTLVQYDLHAQHREGWVEGTRVRYLANNIHVSRTWSPALAHLAYEFRHDVTETMAWAPEGRMSTSAEDAEMAKVAGWPLEKGPWRIMPARIKGQSVNIVAVSEGGSCSAMDTQVWSRNLSKMLGPKETPKDEHDYPFYSARAKSWGPQVWSGPALINDRPYRVDINLSLGDTFVLSTFGTEFEPVQTLIDIPVLKKNPELVYCASRTICNAIIKGDVKLIPARYVYTQPTNYLKTFHWDEQIVADMGLVKSLNRGKNLHLGIAQEKFVSTEGCGFTEERQWPLIQQPGRKLVLKDANSKRSRLKFAYFNLYSKTLLDGNGIGNIRVEFVRIDGKLFIERLAGVPPQLPGSATYWRLKRNGKFERVAEFMPIYRRLTIPLKLSTG